MAATCSSTLAPLSYAYVECVGGCCQLVALLQLKYQIERSEDGFDALQAALGLNLSQAGRQMEQDSYCGMSGRPWQS